MTWQVIQADVMDGLGSLPDASVQTVVTSPPYWGLRDYGTAEWEGGDAACDHLAPLGGGTDATGLMQDGRTDEARNGNAGRIVADRRQQYRTTCGKCGAVRRDQQLGLEPTPEAYVERMVAVFREVRRVLRPDGTVWLNLGDSYASGTLGRNDAARLADGLAGGHGGGTTAPNMGQGAAWGKPKDLVGIPWRVAFALQADGWYLRSDIIWAKPNPMPESVTDRPTKAHEYVFLLTRSARYFYDADAVREPHVRIWGESNGGSLAGGDRLTLAGRNDGGRDGLPEPNPAGRNLRSVWSIATEPYPEAHFATFPKALVVPCVKAGTSEKGCCPECGAAWVRETETTYTPGGGGGPSGVIGTANGMAQPMPQRMTRSDVTLGWKPSCYCVGMHGQGEDFEGPPTREPVPCVVLDPFAGSGTVGVVALRHGRSFIGIELNPTYAEMARERIRNDGPLFNVAAEVTA